MKQVRFLVTLTLPPNCTIARAKEYVENWVKCGRGAHKPPGVDEDDLEGDPIFDLDPSTVKVTRIKC